MDKSSSYKDFKFLMFEGIELERELLKRYKLIKLIKLPKEKKIESLN